MSSATLSHFRASVLVGLDVSQENHQLLVKDGSGRIQLEGTLPAIRLDLDRWMKTLPQPYTAAMEATVFTGWIHDHPVATRSRVVGTGA